MTLPLEVEEYALGRGVKESRIRDLGLVMWDHTRVPADAPDHPYFYERKKGVGPRGQRLTGTLCTPLRCPRGRLLGFESRAWTGEKHVSQFLLAEADWNPVLIGLTPSVMARLWDGGDVFLGEGLFDATAMEHVVPAKDVTLATLRARVSPRHAQFFRRFCRGFVNVVYDNDPVGRKQTFGWVDEEGKRHWGALEILDRVGVKARDLPYRGGKDPGAIWERTGTQGLKRAFAGAL